MSSEAGRPTIPIDWDRVDRLLSVHCPGTEVAAALGIHADTLYLACVREKGKSFTDYTAEKRQKGNTLLREAQANKALVDQDNTMLIWLGKVWLGQTDKLIIATSDDSKMINEVQGTSPELVNE